MKQTNQKLAIQPKSFREKWYLALINGERTRATLYIAFLGAIAFFAMHFRTADASTHSLCFSFYFFMAIFCLLMIPMHFERRTAYFLLKRLTNQEDDTD